VDLRPAVRPKSILEEDPRGRVDIAIVRLGETLCRRGFGPAGATAWNSGLGDLVETLVVENGVTAKPVTVSDMARALGLIPNAPRRRR
jgi:hypothetical protein